VADSGRSATRASGDARGPHVDRVDLHEAHALDGSAEARQRRAGSSRSPCASRKSRCADRARKIDGRAAAGSGFHAITAPSPQRARWERDLLVGPATSRQPRQAIVPKDARRMEVANRLK
jgi:hypothetical protein